ncbi:hypothetical protein MTO96_031501 [Rhipicephalus appendiculatus]
MVVCAVDDAKERIRCVPAPTTGLLISIYAHLDDELAVSDIDGDGVFECVEAVLTEYQVEPEKGDIRKNVSFHISPGTTPDRITFYLDNKTEEEFEAQYLYTDYETCAIVKGPYGGDRCLLLVSRDMADDVPKPCLTNFADLCGVSVNLYSKELCPENE